MVRIKVAIGGPQKSPGPPTGWATANHKADSYKFAGFSV